MLEYVLVESNEKKCLFMFKLSLLNENALDFKGFLPLENFLHIFIVHSCTVFF